jgi:hypothetical protein
MMMWCVGEAKIPNLQNFSNATWETRQICERTFLIAAENLCVSTVRVLVDQDAETCSWRVRMDSCGLSYRTGVVALFDDEPDDPFGQSILCTRYGSGKVCFNAQKHVWKGKNSLR